MNISHLLSNAAQNFTARPAISTGPELLFTYGEMGERVAKLAGGLSRIGGVAPGDRVLLAMSNQPVYLEILFAIWHSGLSAVPVNAKLHPKEVAYIANDCGAKLAFVSEDLIESLFTELHDTDSLIRVIVPNTADYTELFSEPIALAAVNRDDLAWLFYTSGTTGRPKGAKLSHLNLSLMAWSYLCDIDALSETDTLLHLGPQSHAGGLLALSHIAKASHNVMPPSGGFDAIEVADLINIGSNITFFAAPTMLNRLLDSREFRNCKIENLKTIIGGAAPFFADNIRSTLNLIGPRFTNGYGQGECPCTITSMPKRFYDLELSDHELCSVGIQRTGTEVRIVDRDGQNMPAGETGEIVVRSQIVMKGYWNNASATNEAIKDGWLYTGDVGAIDDRGMLYLKDRSKDVIISGGTNIYPGEIEVILQSHPSLLEVSVVGVPDKEWGESVIAFIVPKPDQEIDLQELDKMCLQNLARFKRPKQYHVVNELPRNSTGKVLKTTLRESLSK